jgi:hypothetical protein
MSSATLCSTLRLGALVLPVANSTLQEQQFHFFLETNQAAKKTGKRRTCSEKATNAVRTSSGVYYHAATPQPTAASGLQNH